MSETPNIPTAEDFVDAISRLPKKHREADIDLRDKSDTYLYGLAHLLNHKALDSRQGKRLSRKDAKIVLENLLEENKVDKASKKAKKQFMNEYMHISTNMRSRIVQELLLPFLTSVQQEQIEKDKVRVDITDQLQELAERIEFIATSEEERTEDEFPTHIELAKQVEQQTEEAQDSLPEGATELQKEAAVLAGIESLQSNEHSERLVTMLQNGDIKVDGRYANRVVEISKKINNPSAFEAALKDDPEFFQSLWHRTQLAEDRSRKYANFYEDLTKKQQKAHSRDKTFKAERYLEVKGSFVADHAISMLEVDILKKVFEKDELKAKYWEAVKGMTVPEEVEIRLAGESMKNGAFRKLLEQEDSIVRFFLTVVGPLWGYTVAVANGIIWVQDPSNDKAAFWTAGGALGARLVQTKAYKLSNRFEPASYVDSLGAEPKSKLQRFLRSHREDEKILRSVNWKEVKKSDLELPKSDRKEVKGDVFEKFKGAGVGAAELENFISDKPDLIAGAHNNEQVTKALIVLKANENSESIEDRRDRQWVYSQFINGNFTTAQTREVIDALLQPQE